MSIDTPTPSEPPQNDARQQLLAQVEEAVLGGDEDFALDLLERQTLIKPPDLVEYLCVKAKKEEDPVGTRRWEDAARAYAGTLMDRKFSSDEITQMRQAMQGLDFQRIVENEAEAEEPEAKDAMSEFPRDWDGDEFYVDLDEVVINKVRDLPVFRVAEELAVGTASGRVQLEQAVRQIEGQVRGKTKGLMRLVLDWYVFQEAENFAKGTLSGRRELEMAKKTTRYGSTPEVRIRMCAALDKHVFTAAEEFLSGELSGRSEPTQARKTIAGYATPMRREAMLRRLGFM